MRLGLIATINNSGLGAMCKSFHQNIDVGIHYVVPHEQKGTHLEDIRSEYMIGKDWDMTGGEIGDFITKKPDLVVFFEYPYNWNFVKILYEHKIPIVWFPMIDSVGTPWMRNAGVLDKINYFIAPTKYCHEVLTSEGLPSISMPWPIDTNLFKFKQRGLGEGVTFLHNAGFGGDGNRKGHDLVLRAWQRVRHRGNCKLIVHSQFKIESSMLEGVDYRFGDFKDPNDLYAEGDVYLSPSRKEGLGLPFREAMSCGLPVLGTDMPPINEVITDPELLINPGYKREIGPVQNGYVYEPNCDDLVNKMTALLSCKTLAQKSKEARKRIELDYSWKEWAPIYNLVFEEMVKCNKKS